MGDDLKGFAYLFAAICFILALRGLSSPESARNGNYFGITGMVVAVGITLFDPSILSFELIMAGVLIGRVSDIYLDSDDFVAVVDMDIDKQFDNLSVDTMAAILSKRCPHNF